jgi:Flp pilus assembly protein TadG
MNEKRNTEQGQSLVELAMSLMVLLVLLAGLVDLGRAFFTFITLRDAAQEGAAYATVVNTDVLETSGDVATYCQGITNRVVISTVDLSGGTPQSNGPIDLQALVVSGDVTVETLINGTNCASLAPADVCMGGAVSVKVAYQNFPLTMPLLGTILGSQEIPLSATVVDSILTPACQ